MNEERKRPLAIFGIDAADPLFVARWAREGRLPTLASIMERGWWAHTGGPELVSEHGAWVSILSGISRGRHGYYYYRQLRPGTYDLRTVTGLDVDAPRFWSGLRDRPAALLDVPDTAVQPGLPGVQLAHWATHNNWDPARFEPRSEPPQLLADLRRELAPRLVTVERHDATPSDDREIRRRLLERVRAKGRMCRRVLAGGRFDLIVTVFAETHTANHQFWKYGPGVPDEERVRGEDLEDAIREVYEAVDRELADLLPLVPDEANVVIVGSVGMRDDYPASGLLESLCRELGYVAAPQSADGRSAHPMALARRALPEPVREAIARRLFTRERRERLLARAFRAGADWDRTLAFPIPSAYTGFLRVNLRGREPRGRVEPGAEYDALLSRLEADLAALVDPVSGEPAVTRTMRAEELFGGCPESLPDLFVEWRPGRYMDRLDHPRASIRRRRPDFFRRSDHSSRGFVAAAGPSIPRRGAAGEVEVLDLAPLFLALMGEPVPPGLGGRVPAGLLRAEAAAPGA